MQQFIKELKQYICILPKNTIKTLRGQAISGDVEGARKGLKKVMRNRINRYNSEGYADPTSYQAMINIEKSKKAGTENDNSSGKLKKRKKMEKYRDIVE